MFLGIDKSRYVVYEGDLHWGARPILPSPHIFDMQLGDTPEVAIKRLLESNSVFGLLLLREDTFDPVTMIRRGRVYAPERSCQPRQCRVAPIDAFEIGQTSFSNPSEKIINKELFTYQCYPINSREEIPARYAAIGAEGAFSLWRVVSIDHMHFGEELLTLRPHHSMGALPDLDLSKVFEPWKTKVEETVQKVVDVMNIANADSLIELCRHAAAASFFAHFHEKIDRLDRTDLAKLSNKAKDEGFRVAGPCGTIIAELHSRLKPNNQEHFGSRIPNDRDAELAIYSLSCILSDLGFTNEKR